MTKITFTLTTIKIPYLLENYIKDSLLSRFEDVDVIITGDYKSPLETKKFCQNLQKKFGINIEFMDVNDQNLYMNKYSELKNFIPFNCIQRRNIAILKAYEQGSEIIILMDDDNFISHKNYLKYHSFLGKFNDLEVIKSNSGWFNICTFLKDKYGRKFYPRGFPWKQRINEEVVFIKNIKKIKTVVNAGLWLGDPDIDAVTRLSLPIDVIGYNNRNNFALELGTFSPFNSQNTAIHRDIVPAYFLCPNIARYDDIWASYVVGRIAQQLGHYISYGFPLVKHERNVHDLWIDAKNEIMGTKLTDLFCEWLRKITLKKTTYLEVVEELIIELKKNVDEAKLNKEQSSFFYNYIHGYSLWIDVMKKINVMSIKT